MTRYILPFLAFFLFACGDTEESNTDHATDTLSGITRSSSDEKPIDYPATRKSEHQDIYHGVTVADPYVWLEDDRDPEVEAWVKSQNEVTNAYLSQCADREAINERLTEIWNYEKRSSPWKKGPYLFQYRNNGVQNQDVVYRSEADGEPQVWLDPNTLSEDGTVALSGLYFNEQGNRCVMSTSKAGSDWRSFQVMNTVTMEKIGDPIEWVKFSGASWFADGFFYSKYPEPEAGKEFSVSNTGQTLYYYVPGQERPGTRIIGDDEGQGRSFGVSTFDNSSWAVLYTWASTSGNAISIMNLAARPNAPEITPVVEDFDAEWNVIGIMDDLLYVLTTRDAPNGKVITIDPEQPAEVNHIEIIPHTTDVLESVNIVNNELVCRYLENVQSKLYLYAADGSQKREIELPGIGIVGGINGKKSDNYFYYTFVDYTHPNYVYRYNMETKSNEAYFIPEIDFDSEALETKQVWYTSKDGTKIPMFITHKKDLKVDGNCPTFLFGYGGFNISYKPEFRLDRTVFLENGGVYAVANLRGGGEFGQEWHEAGTKENKQNVFDDFIGAAEYLINEGYTNADKLAIHGRSNGGLLVGAVMTQRPELMKVALPKVGVLDMLKFHQFTIGKYWVTDYGCSENAEDFEYLKAYSPVHNVEDSTHYPATLVMTGDHDDRVVPAHSYKFIAELQAKQAGNLPVLIRIDTDGGHGSGKPVQMQIAEFADTWAFVFHHLGMTVTK